MRLVRFEDESGGFALDLHSRMTVISGLPTHVRERLMHAVAALPAGVEPGGRGLLEVHGVFLDLNRESLELLELNDPIDVVLSSKDLPIAADDPDADVVVPDISEMSARTLENCEDEAREARRVLEELQSRRATAEGSIAEMRRRLTTIEAERAELERELVSVRSGLAPDVVESAQLAVDEASAILTEFMDGGGFPAAGLQSAGSASEAAPEVDDPHPDEDAVEVEDPFAADREWIEAKLAELISESDRLKRTLAGLKSSDTTPVRDAIAGVENASAAAEPEVSPEAESMLAEWIEIGDLQVDAEQRAAEARAGIASYVAAKDAAAEELEAAELALRTPDLDPDTVEDLERVHDTIFELEGRSARFSASKTRRRLELLRLTERELLEALGFDSWSAYILGYSYVAADPARIERHAAAKAAFDRAEAELAPHADAGVAEDRELEELPSKRSQLLSRVKALLGRDPGADPVAALMEHRVAAEVDDAGVAEVAAEQAAERLRTALTDAGAEVPEPPCSVLELWSFASRWVETNEDLVARLEDVVAERVRIEDEISELAAQLEQLPAAPRPKRSTGSSGRRRVVDVAPSTEVPPAATPTYSEVTEARELVDQHEARIRATESSAGVIDRLERRLADVEAETRSLRLEIAEQSSALAGMETRHDLAVDRMRRADEALTQAMARVAGTAASSDLRRPEVIAHARPADVETIEWYLLSRLAQQRSVSFVGSLPFVIDDAFRFWSVESLSSVFQRLQRMSDVIQIIYLTDDPEVGAWARYLGSDRASVIDMRVTA